MTKKAFVMTKKLLTKKKVFFSRGPGKHSGHRQIHRWSVMVYHIFISVRQLTFGNKKQQPFGKNIC